MTDTKISAFSTTTLDGTEEAPLAKSGSNYKAALTAIRDWFKSNLVTTQAVTHSVSGSRTLDYSAGQHVTLTLSANITSFAISNWPASGKLARMTVDVISTGTFTVTGWAASTYYAPGGTAPTITGSGKDTLVFTTTDGGTTVKVYSSANFTVL